MARWLIRITGRQRREVDIDLIVQAVVALGHQLAEEERAGGSAKPGIRKTSTALSAASHIEDAS